MSEILRWGSGLSVGAMAAVLYFGGLWLTVRRLPQSPHPLGVYSTSLLLRVGMLGIVFALLVRHDWRQGVAAGVAFVLVRFAIVSWLLPTNAKVTAS